MRRGSLQHCADTVVGDGNVRGISGGERRRLSLGVELVRMHVCVLVCLTALTMWRLTNSCRWRATP